MPNQTLAFAIQLAQLVTYVFGAITVVVACMGVSAWRRQLVGTRRIQLAERALSLFYKARDRFLWFRARGIFSDELEDIERLEGEAESQYSARRTVAVGLRRFYKGGDVFADIESLQYEFAAVFGLDSAAAFTKMKSATSAFVAAGNTLIDLRKQIVEFGANRQLIPAHLSDDAVGLGKQFWGAGDGSDDVAQNLREAVSEIERICRPILQSPSWTARVKGILARKS